VAGGVVLRDDGVHGLDGAAVGGHEHGAERVVGAVPCLPGEFDAAPQVGQVGIRDRRGIRRAVHRSIVAGDAAE
jgi:hypothetical protein